MDEKILHNLFMNANVPYLVQQMIWQDNGEPEDAEILTVNASFASLAGLEADKMKGQRLLSVYGQDREAAASWLSCTGLAVKEQKMLQVQMKFSFVVEEQHAVIVPLSENICAVLLLGHAGEREATEKSRLLVKNQQLQKKAVTDTLTGLYNRTYVEEQVGRLMRTAEAKKEPLAMLALDIDHFKQINDTCGHLIGDAVLQKFAKVVGAVVPAKSVFIRFGGDEFLLLLPGHTGQDAVTVAERIRQRLENSWFPEVGKITASFGAAEKNQGEDFPVWYKHADAALYHAKNAGRDQAALFAGADCYVLPEVRIRWAREWECGDADIDSQHRELLALSQRTLAEAFRADFSPLRLLHQLERLLRQLAYHFISEDYFLQKTGYPQAAEHTRVHRDLLFEVLAAKDAFVAGKLERSEIFSLVADKVVVGHMLQEDIHFFSYIKQVRRELV